TVKQGKHKGLRTLDEADDLAKELFRMLDHDQKKIALQNKPFTEAELGEPQPSLNPGEAQGLPARKVTEEQKAKSDALLQYEANGMTTDVAETELAQIKEAGLEKVHFAFTGGLESGQAHTYRIQGPTFVVMFLNEQADSAKNPANHIHSAWRSIKGDFGITQ